MYKNQFSNLWHGKILVLSLVAILISQTSFVSAKTKPPFEQWLAELKEEASLLGVRPETLELAFSEITPPVKRIIKRDRSQPEVVQTYHSYLSARLSGWKIDNGLKRIQKHKELLDEIERIYGVQSRFIVSIWGMETNFGTFPIKEPIFNVLATLAYDKRRGAFFRAQFLTAIKMLDSGFPTYDRMKSSWAGAMGQPQFIPDSYQRYAIDHDGDGNADIWNSEADVFASIANYFKANGWSNDQTWGRRVQLPTKDEKSLIASGQHDQSAPNQCKRFKSFGAWRDLQEWQALGVRRLNGADLPARSIPATLVLGDKGDGEAYIVYENFCVLMRYNPAFKYALSIGLLSEYFREKEGVTRSE